MHYNFAVLLLYILLSEINIAIRTEILDSWGTSEKEQEVTQLPVRVGRRWVYELSKTGIRSHSSLSAERIQTHKSNKKTVYYC